jgi:hypothetical protein
MQSVKNGISYELNGWKYISIEEHRENVDMPTDI